VSAVPPPADNDPKIAGANSRDIISPLFSLDADRNRKAIDRAGCTRLPEARMLRRSVELLWSLVLWRVHDAPARRKPINLRAEMLKYGRSSTSRKTPARRSADRAFWLITFLLLLFTALPAGAQPQPPAAAGAAPAITELHGKVKVQDKASIIWENAGVGMEITQGARVMTGDNSSAIVRFPDGSFFTLIPNTEAAMDWLVETDGKRSFVVSVDSGRAWAQIAPGDGTERYIIAMPGGAMDVKEGSFFVEGNSEAGTSCVDVFSGSTNLHPLKEPGKSSKLGAGRRSGIGNTGSLSEPAQFQSAFDIRNEDYSCLPASEKEVTVGNTILSAEQETEGYTIKAKTSAQVQFGESGTEPSFAVSQTDTEESEDGTIIVTISNGTSVSFQKCAEKGESCNSNAECCSYSCENSVCITAAGLADDTGMLVFPIEEIETGNAAEYQMLVFTQTATVTFDQQACAKPPQLGSITVDDESAVDGSTVSVTGDECQTSARAVLAWSAAPVCGSIASVTIKSGNEAKELGTVAEGETGNFSASINLGSTDPVGVEITAADSFGNRTTAKIALKLQLHESLAEPPKISDVYHGEDIVTEGGNLSATIDSCDAAAFTLKGSAAARCGEISAVKVTQDGKPLPVSGKSAWSASYTLKAGSGSTSFEITAADSRGNESEPFNFTLDYEVAANLLEPPAVESVTFNGADVDAGETVDVSIDGCTLQQYLISGRATTPCGTIGRVSLSAAGSQLTTAGTSDWSAPYAIQAADLNGQPVQFVASAMNSAGTNSEPFEFNVNFENGVEPPSAAIETIANNNPEDTDNVMELYSDDLAGGKMAIRGSAESSACTISKVQVSVDEGGAWRTAEGTTSWSFEFNPSEQTYYIMVRSYDAAGTVSEDTEAIEVTYHARSREDDLLDAFKRLIQAYTDKSASGFIDLTSQDYSTSYPGVEDAQELETSLDNRFAAYDTIYLKYTVNSVNVNGDTGRVSFNWDANQKTAGYAHSAVFNFQREEEGWRFTAVVDENTFLRYTSNVASINISSDESAIVADNEDSTTITVEARDSAYNLVADGTLIYFTTTLGTITGSAETVNGVAEATLYAGSTIGVATVKARSSNGAESMPLAIEFKREIAPPPPDD
jgi:hypothetical protein